MDRLVLAVVGVALAVAVGLGAQQPLSTHTLVGRVTDPSGRLLAGVTVDLNRPGETAGMVRSVVTDSNGRYRIERILPGTYVLVMRLAGFASAIRDIEIGGGPEEFEYSVQLTPINGAAAPAPGTGQPTKHVVCGLTLVTPPANVDPRIFPKPTPPAAQPVKPTIRTVQPSLCWEPSSEKPPVPPTR